MGVSEAAGRAMTGFLCIEGGSLDTCICYAINFLIKIPLLYEYIESANKFMFAFHKS